MEERKLVLTNECSFMGVKPIMMEMPYPPIKVREKNQAFAFLLSMDYCGSVSEMTAITQYINNENRLSAVKCNMAKTILGIAIAEMIHLQKLGELIFLLGGSVDFIARQPNGRQRMWTPGYLTLPNNPMQMIASDIEAEKAAISQYQAHIKLIDDTYINDVLERIILDEEYHILWLKALAKDIN